MSSNTSEVLSTEAQNTKTRMAASARIAYLMECQETPILLYQMGKVGSTSVREALVAVDLQTRLIRPHILSQWVGNEIERREGQGLKVPQFLYAWEMLRNLALAGEWRHSLIISMVRDPISRQLSNIFQNPETFLPELLSPQPPDLSLVLDKTRTLMSRPGFYEPVLLWFDRELKRFFDIDVFSQPFPAEGGGIYRSDKAECLVLRTEDLKLSAGAQLAAFLGLDEPLEIGKTHRSDNRRFGELYKQVQQQLSLDEALLDAVYLSPLVQHLYTPEQIDGFRKRWSGEKHES